MLHLRFLFGVFALPMMLFCSGCTAQLTNNTLDMNASYKGLLTKQILYNLGQAIDEPSFFPSQIVVAQGSTVATNTVTPAVSVPLPTSTITSAVAAGASTTVTNTSATALGNAGLSLGLSAQSQFTWGVTPKNDPGELRRLRALYLYAVGKTPISCTDEGGNQLHSVEACFREAYVMQGGKHDVNQAFTQRPGCILCGAAADQSDLTVNKNLRFGFVRKSPAPGFHFFGHYSSSQFYVSDNGGDEAFSEFILFILEAISTADFVAFTPSNEKSTGGPPRVRVPPKSQSNQPFIFTIPL